MFKKIQRDKWRHFFAGILMGAVIQAFLVFILPNMRILAIAITVGLVVSISYGFELFSKITGKGYYDFWDAVATVIGGAIGMAALLIFI
jgi:uncharacterized membrane protein HdeD (DUF308 family)